MQGKVILISDDKDFFEYIIPKLSLRKSDELFRYKFDEIPDKLHLFNSSLLIVNSENRQSQTLELLNAIKNAPIIVFGYNDDDNFKKQAYKNGMFAYFTLSTPDDIIEVQLLPALNYIDSLEKNKIYREMLVKNNLITKNNEVFLDFADMLDRELGKIHQTSYPATLVAISPNEKTKFLIQPNKIETIILNSVRKNDILMNYAPNKYFLLLHNTDLSKANRLWEKIQKKMPEGIYAGITYIGNKTRQQIVNEALNNLHTAMNSDTSTKNTCNIYSGSNFKFFRQEFNKKLEQIITPVFYQVQQTYNDKLFGMNIEQGFGEGYGVMYIKSRHAIGSFRITSPGFSTINIDIIYEVLHKNNQDNISETKRITLEPEELEAGLLQDLLEQFISEFKQQIKKITNLEENNEYT